jgi:hypothetical protein
VVFVGGVKGGAGVLEGGTGIVWVSARLDACAGGREVRRIGGLIWFIFGLTAAGREPQFLVLLALEIFTKCKNYSQPGHRRFVEVSAHLFEVLHGFFFQVFGF